MAAKRFFLRLLGLLWLIWLVVSEDVPALFRQIYRRYFRKQ